MAFRGRVSINHLQEIIIGKPITPEEMNYDPDAPGEYQRVADYLFERVCELGD